MRAREKKRGTETETVGEIETGPDRGDSPPFAPVKTNARRERKGRRGEWRRREVHQKADGLKGLLRNMTDGRRGENRAP